MTDGKRGGNAFWGEIAQNGSLQPITLTFNFFTRYSYYGVDGK